MKILALSDNFLSIERFRPLLERVIPDVLVLAGDYDEGFIPTYHEMKSYQQSIEDRLLEFLKYAGQITNVVLVRGNHEEAGLSAHKYYNEKRINNISGCREISGRSVSLFGTVFLGINYLLTEKNRSLFPIIDRYDSHRKIDVIVTHCDISKLPHIAKLKPTIIIRGHASAYGGPPRYLVNSIPVISTGAAEYSIIDLSGQSIRVRQRRRDSSTAIQQWFSKHSRWWLSPWT